MAIDPRHLAPSEVVRLLNSTPGGEVLSDRQLYRHRERAGLLIGDGKTIDIFRYIAWLANDRHNPPLAQPQQTYEEKKGKAAQREREKSATGRDIGPLPAVVNPERKESCRRNLKLAFETYWPDRFPLPWSHDQLDLIELLQSIILDGGQSAFAIYRGGGKTTISESADEWAHINGHRHFSVIIGATGEAATDILETIKLDLETNDLLYEDFPEVCHPIRAMQGLAGRCNGQTLNGERTRIEWTEDEIILPTVAGSAASGGILRVTGITGRIRGIKKGQRRPDLLLIDDPQTDESAASPVGNRKRLRIIQRAALKLAGPKRKIACMMPCTIIFPGDMVDQLTDREKHPAWNGIRRKLVLEFPTNKKLWDEYREIRADGLRNGDEGRAGTAFYLANREAMDEGAKVAWPEYTKGKASAIQYVMDEFIDDPDGAAAELNNEPKDPIILDELHQLNEYDIANKLNTLPRGIVPMDCNMVTAMIDIGQEVLFWTICAWGPRFGGAVVDYGTFPDQGNLAFDAARPLRPLSVEFPQMDERLRIYTALNSLINQLSTRQCKQDGANGVLNLSLGLIDSGYATDTVHEVLSRSPHRALWMASKGRGVKAGNKPMNDYRPEPGELRGWNWRVDAKTSAKGRFVSFDSNSWKSAVTKGLLAPVGAESSIYIFGLVGADESSRQSDLIKQHPLLTIHYQSEYRKMTAGEGRVLEEFHVRPDNKENHLWDCLIGTAVAASMRGVKFSATGAPMPEDDKPLRLSDIQKAKRNQAPAIADEPIRIEQAVPPPIEPAIGAEEKPVRLSDLQKAKRAQR